MPGSAMIMKDMVTNKRSVSLEYNDTLTYFRDISTRSLMQKKKCRVPFTILCTIRLFHFAKAPCDHSASINLMLFSIYRKLGLIDM